MKVKSWLNARYFAKNYEVNSSPSLTVPDQSLSIREILDRYSRGLPIGGSRVPLYDPEDIFPDPAHMDLADRQTLKEQMIEEFNYLKNKRYAKATGTALPTPTPNNSGNGAGATPTPAPNNGSGGADPGTSGAK